MAGAQAALICIDLTPFSRAGRPHTYKAPVFTNRADNSAVLAVLDQVRAELATADPAVNSVHPATVLKFGAWDRMVCRSSPAS